MAASQGMRPEQVKGNWRSLVACKLAMQVREQKVLDGIVDEAGSPTSALKSGTLDGC